MYGLSVGLGHDLTWHSNTHLFKYIHDSLMGMHAEAFELLKKRHQHAQDVIEEWWNARVVVVPPAQQDIATSQHQAIHADIVREGFHGERIAVIGFVNWVAPCAIKMEIMESHANHVFVSQHLPAWAFV